MTVTKQPWFRLLFTLIHWGGSWMDKLIGVTESLLTEAGFMIERIQTKKGKRGER